jgi:hypothetical protein
MLVSLTPLTLQNANMQSAYMLFKKKISKIQMAALRERKGKYSCIQTRRVGSEDKGR